MIQLIETKSNHPNLLELMKIHYSQPKGFVGRRICYAVYFNDVYYGHIVAGSATFGLNVRNDYFSIDKFRLTHIVNNVFYHVNKVDGKYPTRNFTTNVVSEWRKRVSIDWYNKYGDEVKGFETLVELPRTGELYKRDGWKVIYETKGYTCKRVAGETTESWVYERGGRGVRVWDMENLRPKLLLVRKNEEVYPMREVSN